MVAAATERRTERMLMLTISLKANALFSTVCGATLIIASTNLAELFEVPRSLVLFVGASLIPFAALVWWVSTNPRSTHVRLIIAGDAAWVVSALVLIVGFPQTMSTIGLWALGVVTVVVADLAIAQGVGLRRQGA